LEKPEKDFPKGATCGQSAKISQIAPLAESDLAQLTALEASGLSPWSSKQLSQELGLAHGWHFGYRKQQTDPLCGYIFGTLVTDQAEIRKIAVAPECRRQGVASRLLAEALVMLTAKKTSYCFLEVRESNQSAIGLYRKAGFTVSGKRKNYYDHPKENAIIMEKSLEKH